MLITKLNICWDASPIPSGQPQLLFVLPIVFKRHSFGFSFFIGCSFLDIFLLQLHNRAYRGLGTCAYQFWKGKTLWRRKNTSCLKPSLLGSFLAVFGGHVSHTKRGDNLDFHIWVETSGSLLTPPSGITHFGFHLPSENIKMDRLVWTGFNLHGLEEWSGSSSSTWDNLILSIGPCS